MEVDSPTVKGGGGGGDAPMEQEKQAELLEQILQNEVISQRITSFLSLADMKMASEASRGFCEMIRGTHAFQNIAMLPICKETVLQGTMLVDTEFKWKAVEVDCSIPDTVFSIINDILQSVTFLRLQLARTDKVEDSALVQLLTDLLTNTPKLHTLQIESVFLEHVLHDVLSAVSVQEALKQLKVLEITTGNKKNDNTHYLDCDDDEDGPFPRNFFQLSCIPLQLDSLKLGKICTFSGTETHHVKFIPNLIQANAQHLESLNVHMCEVWKMETMTTIHCPKLKSLELSAYAGNASTVCSFLTNQPPLEELTIRIKEKFLIKVLKVIQGKGHKLKKLHISAKEFKDEPRMDDDTHVVVIDWSFLSNLKNLTDFSMNRPFLDKPDTINQGTGVTFLRFLPPSVTKLKLRGVNNFWLNGIMQQQLIEQEEKQMLLSRFANLRSLSFVRCDENTLDDKLVQIILRKCPRLQNFEITHAPQLTDYAITGLQDCEENVGVSLTSLTGLKHLVIKCCNLITIDSILAVVKFQFLRQFDFLTCYAVSKEDLIKLVGQNPSLESLAVFVTEMQDIHEIKGDLKNVNRRICRVQNLDDTKWVYSDSDSDADEYVNDWADGDSDFSGGGYRGYDEYFDADDDLDHDDDFDDEDEFYDY